MADPTQAPTEQFGPGSPQSTDPACLFDLPDAARLAALEKLIQPGTRIGDYRVLGLIGRGGMGVVLLAEQLQPVERQVALKLMAGRRMDARALTFFEVERQLLARMQHPAIAQIFDAGTTVEGIPYFSMELVEGEPLTRFADHECLSFNERIELFRRICLGVQHAHSRGIVHRDLKPANILVARIDGEPTPKIIDFGVASLSSRAADSRVPVVGTAAYMSPEQIERTGRELDPRSDIYALGVVLFELLTGERPFEHSDSSTAARARTPIDAVRGADHSQLRRRARERRMDPARLMRVLKGDVAAIMLKALANDPDQRYDSASALAEDLERLLEHQPVHAVRGGRWYHLRLFWTRHRLSLSLALLAVLGLVLGLGSAVLSWREAIKARDRAVAEAASANAVSDFFSSRLTWDDPALQCDAQARRKLGVLARRALVDLDEAYKGQPLTSARIRVLLADALLAAERNAESQAQLEQARVQIRAATPEDDPARLQIELEYAANLYYFERYGEALEATTRLIERMERVLGTEHLLSLEARILQADILVQTSEFERARELAAAVLPKVRKRRFDDAAELYVSVTSTLSEAYRLLNDNDRAAKYLQARIRGARRRFGEDSTSHLTALTDLAFLEIGREELDRARSILEEQVIPVYRRHCRAELPTHVERYLGLLYNRQENYEKALPHLVNADRQMRLANNQEELMSTALIWADLAESLTGVGRGAEAIPKLLAADRILARDLSEDDIDRQNVFMLLAWTYEKLAQPEEQQRWLDKVIEDPADEPTTETGKPEAEPTPTPR